MAQTDKYANVLYDTVTESSANTLTFEEVNVGLNMFDKVGLLVSRCEWTRFDAQLSADGDVVQFGLSASNGWSATTMAESSLITFHREELQAFGTPATLLQRSQPIVDDFSTMPGGGLLITPKPLYLFIEGGNLGAAATVRMRMYFTVIKLQPNEYFELLESRQFFG